MFQSSAAPSNPRCPFALYPRNPGGSPVWLSVKIIHLHYPVEPEGLLVLRMLLPSGPNPYGSKLSTDWGLPAFERHWNLKSVYFIPCFCLKSVLIDKILQKRLVNRQNFATWVEIDLLVDKI